MSTPDNETLAYSYVRFSTPDQRKGDSLRRQTEETEAWCAKNGVRLDKTTTLRDLGKSAFLGEHRRNPDRNALAAFLKLVSAGKVPRGSYLVIENLDRLTREDERAALRLWLDILDAGINIVQLHPETVFRHEKSDMMDVMRAIIELSRGHSESARKSERNGATWRNKLDAARAGQKQPPRRKDGKVTKTISDQLPAWVEDRGGKPVAIPERAAVVRRIFQMAAAGYGRTSIVKRLTEEGVPAFGDREGWVDEDGVVRHRARGGHYGSGVWVRNYVGTILKDRRALGEYQPRTKDGRPDGPPVPDYFPRVVSEDEFERARAGALERRQRPGRLGEHVNLFSGLIKDARGGGSYVVSRHGSRACRVLANYAGTQGRATYRSFPLETFEAAVLGLLREIDPHEVLNGDSGPDESLALSEQLTAVETRIAELEAELATGDVPSLARGLRVQEERRRELAGRLAQARQREANPLSASWGECKSLLEVVESAADPADVRLRLRSVLRRITDRIMLLVVPRGQYRLAVAQLWFNKNARADRFTHRDFLVVHKPGHAGPSHRTEARWWARSMRDVVREGSLDLRDRMPPASRRRSSPWTSGTWAECCSAVNGSGKVLKYP
jgi:DNA invertase Pin-like site-specific DNA recombinase